MASGGEVRIISRRTLREFATQHADAADVLDQWYTTAHGATWHNLAEVRQVYPHADLVGNKTVFNIRGNNYRLITAIHYNRGIIYIRAVLTHADYDRGNWRQR
jgi:mRNA interferase HigB